MVSVSELDTPVLLIDLLKMEKNLHKMADLCREVNIGLRPHIKTHKIPEIALKQVELSGNGIAVSKLGEAEVMIDAGVQDILIANEIIGKNKIERLGKLTKRGAISVCVDSIEGIEQLNSCLPVDGTRIAVLIEIDTGMNRCGVSNIDKVSNLLNYLVKSNKCIFKGFLSHSGNIYGASNKEELEQIAMSEISKIVHQAEYWRDKGVAVETASIGSTPSALYLRKMDGITEFRPGNYVFNDYIQVCLGVADIDDCALSVSATVISKPQEDRIIIDAGSKCLGLDRGAHSKNITPGFGYVKEYPSALIERLSEEHGIIKIDKYSSVRIGEKITIIPNHACAAANMFDMVYVQENNQIVNSWKVAARGKVQ